MFVHFQADRPELESTGIGFEPGFQLASVNPSETKSANGTVMATETCNAFFAGENDLKKFAGKNQLYAYPPCSVKQSANIIHVFFTVHR